MQTVLHLPTLPTAPYLRVHWVYLSVLAVRNSVLLLCWYEPIITDSYYTALFSDLDHTHCAHNHM